MFQALTLRQSEGLMLVTVAKLPCYPHRRSTTVSLEIFTLYPKKGHSKFQERKGFQSPILKGSTKLDDNLQKNLDSEGSKTNLNAFHGRDLDNFICEKYTRFLLLCFIFLVPTKSVYRK